MASPSKRDSRLVDTSSAPSSPSLSSKHHHRKPNDASKVAKVKGHSRAGRRSPAKTRARVSSPNTTNAFTSAHRRRRQSSSAITTSTRSSLSNASSTSSTPPFSSSSTSSPNLKSLLANELLTKVFSKLDFQTLMAVAQTCKLFNSIASSSLLLKEVVLCEYPQIQKNLSFYLEADWRLTFAMCKLAYSHVAQALFDYQSQTSTSTAKVTSSRNISSSSSSPPPPTTPSDSSSTSSSSSSRSYSPSSSSTLSSLASPSLSPLLTEDKRLRPYILDFEPLDREAPSFEVELRNNTLTGHRLARISFRKLIYTITEKRLKDITPVTSGTPNATPTTGNPSTSSTSTSRSILDEFLLTYHSFCGDVHVILSALFQRFLTAGRDRSRCRNISLGVLNVFHTWLRDFFSDLIHSKDAVSTVSRFLRLLGKIPAMKRVSLAIRKELRKKLRAVSERTKTPPLSVIKESMSHFNLTTLPAIRIAEQLALIESDLYRRVSPPELLNQVWSKTSALTESPHLHAWIKRFTVMSRWVPVAIISESDIKKRVKLYEKFVDAAHLCVQMKNFSGALELVSGLSSSSVKRLKLTLNAITPAHKAKLAALTDFFSSRRSMHTSILALVPQGSPSLPCLNLCLTDLTFVEDASGPTLFVNSNGDFDGGGTGGGHVGGGGYSSVGRSRTLHLDVTGHQEESVVRENGFSMHVIDGDKDVVMINWAKCKMLARVLSDILAYQPYKYPFQKDEHLFNYLKNPPVAIEESHLFQLAGLESR